jgi:YtkA-like
MKKLLLALALALLAVPAATAGGWATVGLSSLPKDISAGGTWSVDMTIRAHARTPVDGLHPVVRVSRDGGSGTLTYAAKPTGTRGVYRAEVRFPREGTWRYEIWDGYSQTHKYAPVEIRAADSPSSFPTLPVTAIALALAAAAALALFTRRSRSTPRPAPAGH